MLWAVTMEYFMYEDSEWELIGVFSSEAKANEAIQLYLQDNPSCDDFMHTHTLTLDEMYWLQVHRKKREEAERVKMHLAQQKAAKEAEKKAARDAEWERKIAELAAKHKIIDDEARPRVEEQVRTLELKGLLLAPRCTEEDVEDAKGLFQDALRCVQRPLDLGWDTCKPAVERRVQWAISRLQGKLLNLNDDFLPIFAEAFSKGA